MSNDITDIENVAPWIEMFIATWMKEQLKQDVESDSSLAALVVEPSHAAGFMHDLAEFIGMREVPARLILEHPTPGDLARHLAMVIAERTEHTAYATLA